MLKTQQMHLRFGHGPDADDAFIFYAIKAGHLGLDGIAIEHRTESMHALNGLAREGALDMTAVSAGCYPYLADRYWIMSCGGSMSLEGGPVLASRAPRDLPSLRHARIAVPGLWTTATLLLQLAVDTGELVELPYDQIPDAVATGEFEAGLLIHEQQVLYEQWNLHKVCDLGDWWYAETGLPLPLALNVVGKWLGREQAAEVVRLLRQSVDWAFAHPEEALAYAKDYAGGLDEAGTLALTKQFINEHSIDMSRPGRAAVAELCTRASAAGLRPPVGALEIIDA